VVTRFDVHVRRAPALTYESVRQEVANRELDAYLRRSIASLQERHDASGPAFALYMGCDKDDAQLVEVGLPTENGTRSLPESDLAYTVARGAECDYPAILSAYDAVAKYANDSGRALAGPPRETYLGENEMEIAFPLAD
jgi:effector-binding domain-containing protein